MASAMYPDYTNPPAPGGLYDGTDSKVSYQHVSPPAYSPSPVFISQPPQPAPVYIQSTVFNPVIGAPFLGHNPTPIQCPRCRQQVITVVQHEIGGGTWLISLGICVFGGILGCCLIPFCIPACQDAVHTCPACSSVIGRRNLI